MVREEMLLDLGKVDKLVVLVSFLFDMHYNVINNQKNINGNSN